jgi:hypothetical protein
VKGGGGGAGVLTMGGWSWFCCGRSVAGGGAVRRPEPFQLPAPLPEWPRGSALSPCFPEFLCMHLLSGIDSLVRQSLLFVAPGNVLLVF